jgi:hypothetical protein
VRKRIEQIYFSGSLEKQSLTLFPVYYREIPISPTGWDIICVIDQSATENKVIHTLIIDFFSHGLRSVKIEQELEKYLYSIYKTTDLLEVTDNLYHIMLNWVHLAWARFELTTLVVIGLRSVKIEQELENYLYSIYIHCIKI